MSQSKVGSAVEALTNTGVGFVIALGAQMWIADWYGLGTTFAQDLGITTFFTGISILRGYAVRRFFNWMSHR
jgi:hypothetical protein